MGALVKESHEKNVQCDKGFWHYRSYRFYLTNLMGLCIFANTLVRATFSMAMVCMVNTTAMIEIAEEEEFSMNSTNFSDAIFDHCGKSGRPIEDYGGTETWSSAEQGFLFSAIYWGGALFCIPAGLFADRYSPKYIVFACFTIQTIGCLLTPLSVIYGGLIPIFIVRFIMGIGGQAIFHSAMAAMIARWIPPAERSTVIALYSGGNQIGAVIAMPINAWLCRQKYFLGGWPSIFYVNGVVMLISALPWLILVSDKPSQCKWISKEEQEYIETSLSTHKLGTKKGLLSRLPWLKMLMSMALWSCIITNFAVCVMMATLESYVPTYFKEVLHLDLESNGLLSALPHLSLWLSKLVFAAATDYLKSNSSISHKWICRLSNCLNTIVGGIILIACGYVKCGQTALAVTLLTLSNFMMAGQATGYFTSLVCIAPAYTGVVNALTRFSGQIGSVVALYMVGEITVLGTADEWKIVFAITAALLIFSGVHFMFFGSVTIQKWATINNDDSQATITFPEKPQTGNVILINVSKLPEYYAYDQPSDKKNIIEENNNRNY